MEKRTVRSINGQEVRNQELTDMSDAGALADDRILWELFRLAPGSATPQKGIIPYAVSGGATPGAGDGFAAGMTNTALVQGGTSDAKVRVMPFRAVVGSTTLFATSHVEKLRGIRSGYCVGSSSLYTSLAIAANASGQPRWTLVYAAVTPDANGDTLDVKIKDPASGVVSSSSVAVNVVTTVVVTTVDGATGASPARPSAPSDGAGTYYIPLAYLFVPTGFGAASQVLTSQIHGVTPVLTVSSATGAASMAPASEQWTPAGTVDLRQNPSRNSAKRGGAYVPPTMVGIESCFILLQLGAHPISHLDGDVVDRSRDWRKRYFWSRSFMVDGTTSASGFASDANATGSFSFHCGSAVASAGLGRGIATNTGQSFGNDYPGGAVATCAGMAVYLRGNSGAPDAAVGNSTELGSTGDYVIVYVDSTTGYLMIKYSINGGVQIGIWLDATAPFANAG